MEPRRHKITSTERVDCPKTGHAEALATSDTCGGCGVTLTANNADQYGLLTLATSLGKFLGL